MSTPNLHSALNSETPQVKLPAGSAGSSRRMSLGIKLPLLVIPLVLAALLISTYISITTARTALIDTLKNELTSQANSQAELIRSNLIWTRSMSIDLAAAAEAMEFTEEDILSTLQKTLRRNGQIFGSTIAYEPYKFRSDLYYWAPYYSRGNGADITFTQLGNPEYDYFKWDWYTLPKKKLVPVLSAPYFDEGGGNIWMVTWSAPFFDIEGNVMGVATADIAFSQTQDIVNQIEVGKNGYAFLLDNKGTLLGIGEHGGEHQAMVDSMFMAAQSPTARGWSALVSTMMAGNSGFATAVDPQGQPMFVAYAPVGLDTGWSIGLAFPQAELFQKADPLQYTLLSYAGVLSIVFGLVLFMLTRLITAPLGRLIKHTRLLTTEQLRLSDGQIANPIHIQTGDELEDLGEAVNWMATEVAKGFETLEENVASRTQDLARRSFEFETIAKVARDITIIRDLDTLLMNAANVIKDRFAFDHVGIFMIDDLHEYAVLRAATGNAGRQMVGQNHRLKIGESGIVGYVTQTGQPRIALDVNADMAHLRNPLLPDTRSEMALPLIIGGRIIGALDVQSNRESAFEANDIQIMQTLTDQLAVAIDNVRLIKQTQDNLKEVSSIYQDRTRSAWKHVTQERTTAFEYDGLNITPIQKNLPAEHLAELMEGKPVFLRNQMTRGKLGSALLMPLLLHGQLIGTVGIEKDDPSHEWSNDELSIIENATNQASLALENARLLEETQKRAAKERAIGEISARIGGLVDIEKILQTTVQELSRTLPEAEVAIQFERKDQG